MDSLLIDLTGGARTAHGGSGGGGLPEVLGRRLAGDRPAEQGQGVPARAKAVRLYGPEDSGVVGEHLVGEHLVREHLVGERLVGERSVGGASGWISRSVAGAE
jgi:hypothetical protein